MTRIYYEVFGNVQGVGFRMSTVDLARRHFGKDLTGYVRNTDRDTVEGEAQGDKSTVENFVKELERGPAGRVDKVTTKEIDVKSGETRFSA